MIQHSILYSFYYTTTTAINIILNVIAIFLKYFFLLLFSVACKIYFYHITGMCTVVTLIVNYWLFVDDKRHDVFSKK